MSLKGLSYREVARKLRKAGFKEVSQKGSHVKFTKETDEVRRTAIVPKHRNCFRNNLKYSATSWIKRRGI